MHIVTWNVNGMRSVVQKGFIDFLQRRQPDILCLQETKAHPEQLEAELLKPNGYVSYWSAAQRAGYSGTATFCRTKPLEVQYGFGIPKFDAEGRMVVTRFREFTLFNVYFPNGGSGLERHRFKQDFLKYFGQHILRRVQNGESVIVVGDYNVAYLDMDVYDPVALAKQSGFLPEEREWLRGFLAGGMVDSFRYFHPNAEHRFSWWAYYENARAGNRGWRIDHILVSRNLENRLKSAEIWDEQQGSDHCPVMAELKF